MKKTRLYILIAVIFVCTLAFFACDMGNDGQEDEIASTGDQGQSTTEKTDEEEVTTRHSHDLVIDDSVDPTCIETGLTKGMHCSVCGEIIVAQEEIDALGHTEVADEAVSPTCIETGLTEGSHCSVCGEIIVAQKEVDALGHTEVTDEAVSPTCIDMGLTEGSHCSVCGEVTVAQEKISALGHDWNKDSLCNICNEVRAITTEGLLYVLINNGEEYAVCGVDISVTGTDIVIPETHEGKPVTQINAKAFENKGIVSIAIPESVGVIGDSAFSGCGRLASIELPTSVTVIGDSAFWQCSSLKNIDIGDGILFVGSGAFTGCESLTYHEYDNALYLGNSDNRYVVLVCEKNEEISSCEIHGNTKIIMSYAFSGCSALKNIEIPISVRTIGGAAFMGCTGIESMTVPFVGDGEDNNKLGYFFDKWLFVVPSTLKSVTVLGGKIGNEAFKDCSNLTGITIGEGVERIGEAAFENCSSLQRIELPSSVVSIGDDAFKNCTSLKSANFTASVTDMGKKIFSGCTSLESITVPFVGDSGNNSKIDYIFGIVPASLKSVTVLGGDIGEFAFSGCTYLTSIHLPDGITRISESAIKNCTSLQSIVIPDGVTNIAYYAFKWCSSLKRVEIPASVTIIGSWVFENCTSLTDIVYGGTKQQWESISKGWEWDANAGDYTVHCIDGDLEK